MVSNRKQINAGSNLFFFLIILIHISVFGQTTPIPDPSFEQALIDTNIDTNGLNGNILNSDATGVETLNIYNKNITSLVGLEAFTDLKYLYCYFNNIQTINIQNNLELEVLDIENNSIQSIDLSNNHNLKQIYLSNNFLEVLDVSQNSELELLACSLNDLSVLDVSNNLELEVLWCYSNNLSSLDVSNNLLLDSLFCGENSLDSLDVSNNIELESISSAGNSLQSFSFTNCIDLSYLDVSGNNLTTIDVNSNLNLKRLLANNNSLTEIDLHNSQDLLLLFLSGNQLSEIDLSENYELKYVHLDNNQLNSVDIRNSENASIADFKAINNPDLTCVFVDDQNAEYLSDWEIDPVTTFIETNEQCNALTVKDVKESDVSFNIYPNPATDVLNISIVNESNSLNVFNANGQVTLNTKLNKGLNQININHLSSGLYVLVITSEKQSIIKKLLIN